MFQTYDFNVGRLMFKANENDLPNPLQKSLNRFCENPTFFRENIFRLKQTKKGIFSAGPKKWNNLPNSCKTESNPSKFKVLLKKHILEQS